MSNESELVHVGSGKPKEVAWDKIDLSLKREGTQIVLPSLPAPMTLRAAKSAIERMIKSEETEFAISETVPYHFFDGLVAFAKALKERYGQAMAVPTEGFFGPNPPRMIPVRTGTGPNDVIQVPYGEFNLPNVKGSVKTQYVMSRGIPCLSISAVIWQRDKDVVLDLVLLTKIFCKKESIYKGKAIVLDKNEAGKLDFEDQLKFFDPFIGTEVPIFDAETDNLIEQTVLTPIRRADVCRKNGIPLKRGVLLEGPYGTGKSLVAKTVAKECVKAGWTFISCTEATAIKYAAHFARMYQPCVLFAEDMDRIADQRGDDANSLINDIDGVVSKTDEIMVVFTTNFPEKIDKAFLRPGRLDAVISLKAPQKEAIEALVRQYAGGSLSPDTKLVKTHPLLAGKIPAVIREVTERAKLAMVMTGNTVITDDDLYVSALSMQNHLDILARAEEGKKKIDPLEETLKRVVDTALKNRIDEKYMVGDDL